MLACCCVYRVSSANCWESRKISFLSTSRSVVHIYTCCHPVKPRWWQAWCLTGCVQRFANSNAGWNWERTKNTKQIKRMQAHLRQRVFLIISFANNLCSLSLEVLLVALSICGAYRPWFNRWLWQGQWNADCRHLWIYTIATAAMVLKCFEFVWEPGSIQCHSWRFGVSVCLILRLLTHLLAALFQMVFVQGGTLVPLEPRTGAKTCQADRLPMHRMCTVAKTWQN